MMNKTCQYHMEVNAYKYHLQNYLLYNAMGSSIVRYITSLLIDLQLMSKMLQNYQVR